jgi:hypothetical protein
MTAPAHIFKTARRQMAKIRHRGPQTDTERRLLASADEQREQGLGWRFDGFHGMGTDEIFSALRRFGIDLDEASFRDEALQAGSPTRLAERWEVRSSAEGKWRDLPLLGARELWRRLLPQAKSAEVVADEVDELLLEAEISASKPELWLKAARWLIDACARDGGRAFLEAVAKESGSDLVGWMMEMPAALLGTHDEQLAPDIALSFAALADEKAHLAERAELLGRLGRRAEAVAQLEALLDRFPDDPVVLLKAGAALEALGEVAQAQDYYRRYTEAMQQPASAKSRAAAAKAGVALTPRPASALPREPAVGPNDRCPCGSGKKYKRCHALLS